MAAGIRRRLLAWYRAHRRDLPWRRDTDPYRVWVSETMLQQTTVAAVAPRFEQWLDRFPDVEALAAADEQEVLAAWQGLGYYRRARNLALAARVVAANGVPGTFSGWKELPGVGDYTAGAVCSIALGLRVPCVDANVERVHARFCGDGRPGAATRAREWAAALADCRTPGDVNQALMELGATVCTPVNPECERCPLKNGCTAFARGLQSSLPVKPAKKRKVHVSETVLVPWHSGRFGLRKIERGKWWEGMWGFMTDAAPRQDSQPLGVFRYTVTNHHVSAGAYLWFAKRADANLAWLTWQELQAVPVPSPHRRILEKAHAVVQAIGSNATGTANVPSSARK